MCNSGCIEFGVKNLTIEEVKGKKIVEVGSYDVNGSLRPIIESWGEPAQYIGVDIMEGSGVDMICDAEDILDRFGRESFDVVISTELLEHVRDWRKVFSNLKQICKKEGVILITTRSYGFGYHGHPYDFWRYEPEDMEQIFSDCRILSLQKDSRDPGVYIKVQKPADFDENKLSDIKLYSIIADERVTEITSQHLKDFSIRYFLRKVPGKALKNILFKAMKLFY